MNDIMKFWMKSQKKGNEYFVAVCDENLLGKSFDDFEVKEDFYRGNLTEWKEVEKELNKATIANLLGNDCVSLAEEKGIVTISKKIKNIKYAIIIHI